MDAAGLLGCYFRRDPTGAVWASSSPALLTDLPGMPAPRVVAPPPAIRKGLDWCPPPASRLEGVDRLLPSQRLRFAHDEPVAPAPFLPEVAPERGYGDTLDRLEGLLTGAVRALADLGGPVWLPLTAGHDSRLLLAAADRAGDPVVAYTFVKPRSEMARADLVLPPRLAALVGVEHRLIARSPVSAARSEAWDRHTLGHSMDVDREYVARGMWGSVPDDATILRGGVLEAARCYYWRRLPPEPGGADEELAAIDAGFGIQEHNPGSPIHRDGLARWVEWSRGDPRGPLDWRDRFYLEQRAAGWLSAVEQGLDVAGHGGRRARRQQRGDPLRSALGPRRHPHDERAPARSDRADVSRSLELPFNPPPGLARRIVREAKAAAAADDKFAHIRARLARRRG